MQGKYVTEAERQQARRVSDEIVVPELLREELLPIKPWLDGRAAITALDIGANKGFWAKALLTMCGDNVRHIHLVDPSPENCKELARREGSLLTFDPADCDKMSVHAFAMGAKTGRATLYTNEDGSPLASLYPHALNGYGISHLSDIDLTVPIDVAVTTVDTLLDSLGNPHIDIMKMDVEGHEFAVLEGADQALSRGDIDIVALEFGAHQVESRHFFKDFYALLMDHGFAMSFIRDGALHEVTRYEYQYENFTSNFQLVALRRDGLQHANDVGLKAVQPQDGLSADRSPSARQHAEQLQRKDAEIAELRLSVEHMRAMFEQSTSWKLTAPLRKFSKLLR